MQSGPSYRLQPPYVGPFRVLQRDEKSSKIQLSDRVETVSIDQLKPAGLESSTLRTAPSSILLPPTQTAPQTRSDASADIPVRKNQEAEGMFSFLIGFSNRHVSTGVASCLRRSVGRR